MTSHYPLDGIDRDFSQYVHRPLGPRDILVNRVMNDFMTPRKRTAEIYSRLFDQNASFHPYKSCDRRLGLDLHVLSKLLKTDHDWACTAFSFGLNNLLDSLNSHWFGNAFNDALVLGLVERHYFESDPSIQIWLKHFQIFCSTAKRKEATGWKSDMIQHLKDLQRYSEAHYRHLLYSGGHYLPVSGPAKVQFCIDPCFISFDPMLPRNHRRIFKVREQGKPNLPGEMDSVRQGRPRRPSSVPPPGAWGAAAFDGLDKWNLEKRWVIYFPRRPLSELDKLSRRRSLSRTHIREMFRDRPKWAHRDHVKKRWPKEEVKHPCANCTQHSHRTKHCPSNCGYCNSIDHKASACPVKVTNRCKCRPFPQYHTAFDCYVRCSRRCGCPHPPGHLKHKNAVLCRYRCCMCGSKGHTGRKCALKKCPCGGQHLTQDCRWKVECPVKDCNLYLCHLHCRECGKKKDKDSKDQFVGKTCQECLGNGKPVSDAAE
ncbi:hypothetical protein GGR54DRAFT_601618 [Hypoxylon sp. NC1633]|nr:hypothetical protein GGR54DRAFT_601618 [Hypoxylon sp. NC1633]